MHAFLSSGTDYEFFFVKVARKNETLKTHHKDNNYWNNIMRDSNTGGNNDVMVLHKKK
jgi:hypothetical protein